ncbi:MAG: aminotransferase class V-fold PLP-dependent enzyme [Acidimicrobiaceae bacterium]|nr:aminotransferase class V-fold PLP-dependent enzyme [Acidimicrobiaceae bacterium]
MIPRLPLTQIRKDTPGVDHVLHFNNAGAALPPKVVLSTVVEHLEREAMIGGYEAAGEASTRLEAVYDSLAQLIGAEPHQMAVVENATRAWDMAVYGYPFSEADRVLMSRAEYVSNVIALLQLQKRHSIEPVLIEDDEHGQIDLEHLEAELARGAAMVALTHAPTNSGLINPVEAVGALCKQYDVFYVLDACQSAGQVPLDVGRIGCDVLSGTGRKYLRGPRGTGFLYAGPRALERIEPPFLDLHAAHWTTDTTYEIRSGARRFENWEANYAGKLGLGAAVDYALNLGVEATSQRLCELADSLRESLGGLDGVSVHDKGAVRGGIVTFTVDGMDSADVQAQLSAHRINTTTSPASHARLDLGHRGLPSLVRASVHYYNNSDEVARFVTAVSGLRRSGNWTVS